MVLRLLGTAGDLADAGRCRHLQTATLTGTVSVEQARAIARALDALPTDLDPAMVEKAELHLIEQAAHFDAEQLLVLGRRVLEVIAPDVADTEEQRQLEAEERRARQTTRLTLRSRGDGTTDLTARISDATAHRLRTYLEAHAAPRRGHLDPTAEHTDPATGERIGYPVLLGQAFCSMLEAIPTDKLPQHGGSPTTVLVMIKEKTLIEKVGAAQLTTGDKLSAAEALRLACTAHLMPMVLSGTGLPLHLGRSRREYTGPQRIAMAARDRHCRAEGCTIPADWCEAHHLTPWSTGGNTDLDHGVLFSPLAPPPSTQPRLHDRTTPRPHLPIPPTTTLTRGVAPSGSRMTRCRTRVHAPGPRPAPNDRRQRGRRPIELATAPPSQVSGAEGRTLLAVLASLGRRSSLEAPRHGRRPDVGAIVADRPAEGSAQTIPAFVEVALRREPGCPAGPLLSEVGTHPWTQPLHKEHRSDKTTGVALPHRSR